MGICAFFNMSNLFGVVVFQRSVLDLEEGVQSVCHGYRCILLYINLILRRVFSHSVMGICAFSICETSLLYCFSIDQCWIGGGGGVSLPLVYIILLYVKLICCSGFAEIYARLEEGVESVCHGYICILLDVNLIWCNDIPEIYI